MRETITRLVQERDEIKDGIEQLEAQLAEIKSELEFLRLNMLTVIKGERVMPGDYYWDSQKCYTPISYGWVCPKCSAVWSPTMTYCANCMVVTYDGTTPIYHVPKTTADQGE